MLGMLGLFGEQEVEVDAPVVVVAADLEAAGPAPRWRSSLVGEAKRFKTSPSRCAGAPNR